MTVFWRIIAACGAVAAVTLWAAASVRSDAHGKFAFTLLVVALPGVLLLARRAQAQRICIEAALSVASAWTCYAANVPGWSRDGNYLLDDALPNLVFGAFAGWVLACILMHLPTLRVRERRFFTPRFSLRRLFGAVLFASLAVWALTDPPPAFGIVSSLLRDAARMATATAATFASVGILFGRAFRAATIALALISPVLGAFVMAALGQLL